VKTQTEAFEVVRTRIRQDLADVSTLLEDE